MSHFAVLVRLPGSLPMGEIEDGVRKILFPYKESYSEEEEEASKPYMKFKDTEDESRKKFEEGTMSSVRLADGQEFDKWDERFRKKPTGDLFATIEDKYQHPKGAVFFDKPFKERYGTFERYMEEYEGIDEREPSTGRYGYFRNPRATWDWYQIGGRWAGSVLSIKPGTEDESIAGHPGLMTTPGEGPDICRIKNIDFDHAAERSRKLLAEAWEEWSKLVNDGFSEKEKDGWGKWSARDTAHGMGLIVCKDEHELNGAEWKKELWPRQNTPGVNRYDVYTQISEEEYKKRFETYFDPIRTYAYVDPDQGWQAPGKMGWWGVSHEQPEDRLAFSNAFYTWLRGGDAHDWLVVVDCHI
jgi:hypothetical protein